MASTVERREAPEWFLALSAIADPDYTDFFTLAASPVVGKSAEEWTRAAFTDAFASFGGRLLQRGLLRVRASNAPGNVSGWAIGATGDDWVRLEAQSSLLTANAVVHVDGDRVSAGTVIRYKNPLGAGMWLLLSPLHLRFLPDLLSEGRAALAALPV